MRTRGMGALLLAVAAVTAACGPTGGAPTAGPTTEGTVGAEVPSPSPEPNGNGSTEPHRQGEDSGGVASARPSTPTEPPRSESSRTPIDDLGAVGANGRAFLRPDRPLLIVEIDNQEGAAPSPSAVDHLLAVIEREADKAEVLLAGGNTFSSDRREWSRDDLRAAAQQHRAHHSDDDTAVLYVLYVRGGFHHDGERTEAVGVAHNASEMALFPDRWSGIGGLLGADRDIERAILVHELGHLLGLVNLTYTSEIDHEDPEHPGHSSNRRSVMYWAVETTLIGQVFDGPPPDDFDDADRADIEGLRTGRY